MIDSMPSSPTVSRPLTAEAPEHDAEAKTQGGPEAEIAEAIARQAWRAAALHCARHYGPDVGRLCQAMLGDRALAEEAAQEALLSAYQSLPSFRGEAPVRVWLLGVARKKCLRLLEQRRRHQRQLALVEQPANAESAEEWLTRKARAQRARNALSRIRPTEREALLLRYQSELSYEAIASICALDAPAARKRVSRGLLRLRALLAGQEQDPETAPNDSRSARFTDEHES